MPLILTPDIIGLVSDAVGSNKTRLAAPRLLKSCLQYSALLSVGYGFNHSVSDNICDACVLIKSNTSPDVALGLDSKNNATTQATTGDAADVPLNNLSTKFELYLA